MRCTAIILAGGSSARFREGDKVIFKQFEMLADKEILAHTIGHFQDCDDIDEIYLTLPGELIDRGQVLCKKYAFDKVRHIIVGGNSRQDSAYRAILLKHSLKTTKDKEIVIIHDGARPFINKELINKIVVSTAKYKAAILAIKSVDTIKIKSDAHIYTINRDNVYMIQTPQGFELDLIKKANEQAALKGYEGTDDSSLVEAIGVYPHIVQGSNVNIKITTKDDMAYAQYLIKEVNKHSKTGE
jgi:2-C-methyl-D-erythritol 4-phosphate cytidylyltransferase